MAPLPKPPGQRRRRNADSPSWRQLPAEGRDDGVPETRCERVLGDLALAYWRVIWSSPMAAAYTVADEFPLTRLVELFDERARGDEEFRGDAEMRQLEDRFGISPMARRKLQWEIAQAEQVAERKPAQVRRLRAVDPKSA